MRFHKLPASSFFGSGTPASIILCTIARTATSSLRPDAIKRSTTAQTRANNASLGGNVLRLSLWRECWFIVLRELFRSKFHFLWAVDVELLLRRCDATHHAHLPNWFLRFGADVRFGSEADLAERHRDRPLCANNRSRARLLRTVSSCATLRSAASTNFPSRRCARA